MTDSSSEDEDRFKLLQSIDEQFIDNTLYGEKSKKYVDKPSNKQVLPPSLRCLENDQSDQYSTSGLHITPEFQKYVAKHLSSLIERNLKEVELPDFKCKKKKRKRETGIRLLHSSTFFVDARDLEDTTATHNAKWKSTCKELDSEDETKKLVECAVNSDWILSGEAIKGWVQSSKGEVLIGLHNNSDIVANGKSKKKKKRKKTSIA